MKVLFPELIGMNGGTKYRWLRNHPEAVLSYYDLMGFSATLEAFNMKAETLIKLLKEIEIDNKPVITEANRAMRKADIVRSEVFDLKQEVINQGEVLNNVAGDFQQFREAFSDFCVMQSKSWELMSRLAKTASNFTEHIRSASNNKVGPTLIECRDRLLDFSGPGRKQLPGPKSRVTHKHRTRKGWPGV